MNLGFQTIQGLVSGAAAAIQGACTQILDLTVGSPLRAILEANAAQTSWQQANILSVARAIRLTTATGGDVDSFVLDYGLFREPPVAAVGTCTFSRFSPLGGATVLVGATARTADGSSTVVVTADSTNSAWSASAGTSGGYVLAPGVASVTVPVANTVAGSSGNLGAGTVVLMGDATPGVDAVTNTAGLTGGLDAESDADLKARFRLYIASLAMATRTAIEAAIEGVQQGLTCLISANVDEVGAFNPGHFVVVIDDGSGHPSDDLKGRVYAAVDAVKALAETFSVQSPAVVPVSISLALTVAGSGKAAVLARVQQAVTTYANATAVGGTLSLTRVAAAAYSVDPSITNVSHIRLNGTADDITPASGQVFKVSSVTVS